MTFYRAAIANRWIEIPVDTLVNDHLDIYDDYDREHRHRLTEEDILNMPMLNDEGREVEVYDENGWRIPRRRPIVNRGVRYGVLTNLRTIDSLFASSSLGHRFENEEGEITPGRRNVYTIYPQACLREYGHFQANTAPLVFQPYLASLNEDVGRRLRVVNAGDSDIDMDSEDEDEFAEWTTQTPVTVSALQFYELSMHRARRTEQDFEILRGLLTALLGGSYAVTDKEKRTLYIYPGGTWPYSRCSVGPSFPYKAIAVGRRSIGPSFPY